MKTLLRALGIILIAQIFSFGQAEDSLIALHPILGDTVDVYENNTYNLFPGIKGFESAVFYTRDNKYLVAKVKFVTTGGAVRDTVISEPINKLQNKRARIRLLFEEKKEKISKNRKITLFTKDGSRITGGIARITNKKIVMFLPGKSNNIYLARNYFVAVPTNEVKKILIHGESKILSDRGWGALIGAGSGLLIGFISGDDTSGWIRFSAEQKALMLGTSSGIIGGLIGLITGLISTTSDEVIYLRSKEDLRKLKRKFPYSF